MNVKLLISIILCFHSVIFSQDYVKVEFGNGTSNLSNFSMQVNERDFSGLIQIKRLKSTLRNMDIEFSEDYNNEYVKVLLGVVSASADGILITGGENSETVSIEIGKISYALNDWDLFVTDQGPRGIPTMSAKLNIQNVNIKPPNKMVQGLNQDEWRIFNFLTGGDGALDIKKVSAEIDLNNNGKFTMKGNLDLPIGKAIATATMSMGRDFQTEPYLDVFQLNITNLSPDVKSFMDEMVRSGDMPLKKKGSGYTLRMSGDIDNPRIY